MPINLLPHQEPPLLEKLFSWILTFGRFIIIGVELVVLLAFLSRFKLDRDLVDLHDKIKGEELIVKSLSNIEKKSINFQKRLAEISSLNKDSQNTISVLLEIPGLIPSNVFLDNLTLQGKRLKIEARTPSGVGTSALLQRLNKSSYLKNLSLDKISRDESLAGQIKFTITADLNYASFN